MQEPTFLVLTALANGEKHGYALIDEISQISAGAVTMGVGTLYSSLDRLSRQGLICRTRDEVVAGRTRRFYKLTENGVTALDQEVRRLEARMGAARQRLRATHPSRGRSPFGSGT